jgi:hypothetical protein
MLSVYRTATFFICSPSETRVLGITSSDASIDETTIAMMVTGINIYIQVEYSNNDTICPVVLCNLQSMATKT